eukprot:TRINITY_DN7138_c0_g1_i2.p1 TRINITY_DN7138_c0_g1~~TRINITY_DN7138_c0_g1_i2.p1  ORF type:complete len:394 (+),score=80.46 TRINITY_DN7138_c0_g1_i2:48-1229(+)
MELVSCDTFVVLADKTESGEIIFGKNSDRPCGEIQEVVHYPSQSHQKDAKLKCTYIEIDQVEKTHAVILSKPEWMWGAEMGANEHGVVIGNEAVWNRLSNGSEDLIPRLLGMDLLRLGLERGATAREALDTITALLDTYGQGGQCSNIISDFSYHNSFLIADQKEAWVLETAEKLWVAELVTTGVRNISNCMSITTNITLCHPDLKPRAKKNGWWDGETDFNWCQVIGVTAGDLTDPGSRFSCGRKLLETGASQNKFTVSSMMSVLRDEPSGINRPSGNFPTAGSQVSILGKDGRVPCHWFTATPSPTRSIFKPFTFKMELPLSPSTNSSSPSSRERKHELWVHQADSIVEVEELRKIEDMYINKAMGNRNSESSKENLFNAATEEELTLYCS